MTTVPFVFFSNATRLFAIVLANFWKHDEQRETSTSGSQKPQRMWTFGLREPRQSLLHVPYWVDEASVKAQQDIDTIRGRDTRRRRTRASFVRHCNDSAALFRFSAIAPSRT